MTQTCREAARFDKNNTNKTPQKNDIFQTKRQKYARQKVLPFVLGRNVLGVAQNRRFSNKKLPENRKLFCINETISKIYGEIRTTPLETAYRDW